MRASGAGAANNAVLPEPGSATADGAGDPADEGGIVADAGAGNPGTVGDSVASVRAIVVYLIFMIVFTIEIGADLQDDRLYYFAENLKQQFVGVEMRPEFSPVLPKTFLDVATVEEYYHWMQSAFVHSAFSPYTFDAGAATQNDIKAGSVFGHNVLVGGVRIAQLRSRPSACSATPGLDDSGHKFKCFGDERGDWSKETESLVPFGSFSPPARNASAATPFLRDGIHGVTGLPVRGGEVARERSMPHSSMYTKKLHHTYLSPTHAVMLDARDGLLENARAVENLTASGYIDLQVGAGPQEEHTHTLTFTTTSFFILE